jgi:cell division protein FtsA
MAERVAVLDLGTTKVVALSAMLNDAGELIAEAVATAPAAGMVKSQVHEPEKVAIAVESAVRRLQQELGREVDDFIVTLSGASVECTLSRGFKPIVPKSRQVTRQDVLEVVQHSRSLVFPNDREPIQALPREFVVDGRRGVRQPVGLEAGNLEVVTSIVSAHPDQIRAVESCVSRLGKQIDQFVFSGMATGVGVLTASEMEAGAAVVDLGAGSTSVCTFSGGSLETLSPVPIGAAMVTSDLAKLLKTTPEEAERLKTHDGNALARLVNDLETVEVMQEGNHQRRPMQRRVLCEIIEARMREIAGMVRGHLERTETLHHLPAGIILAGGGSRLAGVETLFQDVLPEARVKVAEPKLALRGVAPWSVSAAVGLAAFSLQCFEELVLAEEVKGWQHRVRTIWSLLSGRK